MSISYFTLPTSENIVYKGAQANLSTEALRNESNKNKVLYNNESGNVAFIDGLLLDAIEEYANVASFPAVGEYFLCLR